MVKETLEVKYGSGREIYNEKREKALQILKEEFGVTAENSTEAYEAVIDEVPFVQIGEKDNLGAGTYVQLTELSADEYDRLMEALRKKGYKAKG